MERSSRRKEEEIEKKGEKNFGERNKE